VSERPFLLAISVVGWSESFDSSKTRVPYSAGFALGGDGVSGFDGSSARLTGVKVFSATKAKEREELGDHVTRWLRSNADLEVVERVVTQSSDNEFHCLTIVLFYREKGAA
jgi:hypothetical protein